jgi:hypothetical protein
MAEGLRTVQDRCVITGGNDCGEPSLTPFGASVIVKIGRWKHPSSGSQREKMPSPHNPCRSKGGFEGP